MNKQRGPLLLLIICAVMAVSGGYASTIQEPARQHASAFYGAPALHVPSAPDDWLGGTGNWSNPADWSAGLPGSNSDVSINTGSDNVTLDTSSSINSLVLGGATGSSMLTGDGNVHTLTIAGALTVNQSGNLYLSADTVTAGASSTNLGSIDLEYASFLQVNGDFNNSGQLYEGQSRESSGSALTVTGTLTNSGAIQIGNYDFLGSGSLTVGGLANTGSISLMYDSTLSSGNATNSGRIGISSYSTLSAGNLFNSGSIQMAPEASGASISVGTLTNTGSVTIAGEDSGASLGALVNQGGVGLGADPVGQVFLTVTGDVSNSGTISVGGGGSNQINIGGTLTNSPGAQFNMSQEGGGASTGKASIGNLINGGSISILGYLDTMSVGSVINTGTIDVDTSSTLQVTGNVNNSGTITLSLVNPQATPGAALTVGGALTNNLGGSLVLYGLQNKATMGSLSNSGSVDLENQSTLQVNGDVTNSGQLTTSYYGNGLGVGNTISISGKLTNNSGAILSLDAASDVANVGYITNAGTVSIASGAALNVTGGAHAGVNALPGFINSGIVNISQGATLASPLSYVQTSGQTTIDGTLNISGRGMVNFAGGSLYGNQGTIQGSITSNGAINIGDSPMTVGQLSFIGNYMQGANGSLTFDIAGAALGQYDQLNVSGHATLNGLMTVDLINGFVPQVGNMFDIMNFSSRSGTFSLVLGLPINNQEHFELEYNSTNLMLDVVAGQLTEADLGGEAWFASTTADNNGVSLIASAGAPHDDLGPSTPEPGTFLLLGSGLLCLGYAIRRRSTK